ncbi:nucleoid-associated protein [Enterococcus sp. CSURQ0835]|uniref:nucleoid-associated protein n=1 Tax=Enterococcus sp. CSURQ0835 TaxID=2681394 RepID=UPI001357C6EC|nr:nucleoid-associated protein [Enterococcus sp. CSURQ0835]
MDIYLKQAILQIIDRQTGPIFSTQPLDLTKEFVREYLIKKIQKLASAQTKTGTLVASSAFATLSQQAQTDFIACSQAITERWYEQYQASEEAPSCDIFVVLYEQDTQLYLAFLKVDYHEGYTHLIDSGEAGVQNELIVHQALLSGKTQKADEGLSLNLSDLTYELIEKKYVFSGTKQWYFSTRVIEAQPLPSLEENVKVIKKVAEKIGAKFEAPKHDVVADVKEAVYESVEETGQIDAEAVAEKVFKTNLTAKQAFKEEVAEKGYIDQAPLLRDAKTITEKKYGKQKLKLSNGIELIVPLEVYRNPDLIEFTSNPDGTISVMIKNVDEVINRL